jgi:spore germination protein GerM
MMRLLGGLALGGVLALTACTPTTTTSPSPSPSTAATTAPIPTESASATSATASIPETMTVTVYFSNSVLDPGASDCAQVYAVHRTVPASSDVLTVTLKELVAGPTAAEAAKGYGSWFSPATAQALVRAKVTGNTSYVNLTDVRTVIPNASTSCGSTSLLAQLRTTAQQAAMTPRVLYAINGQPTLFWEWLQMGCDLSNDNCDPTPFAS